MGLRGWMRQQLDRIHAASGPPRVDLVETVNVSVPVPKHIGLDSVELPQPWSVARLSALFREAAHQPSTSTLEAARIARHRLSCFWASAPVDQLESFYGSDLGELQALLLDGPLVRQGLAQDEQQWADRLRGLMAAPEQQSRQLNLLLALIPYTQPGELSLVNPLETLPAWLLPDYIGYCQPELEAELNQPAGLLEPGRDAMEPLTERRGDDAMAWFRDQATLNHMQDLIARYSEQPDSDDLAAELAGLRVVLAQLWLDVEPIQLQTLWHTPVGEISKALIQVGLGHRLLDAQDQRARQQLVERARDLSQPNAPAVILAMMMFYPPGQIGFKTTDQLPRWFVEVLNLL